MFGLRSRTIARYLGTCLLFLIGAVVTIKVVTPSITLALPEVLYRLGITSEDIKVAGTGSMYPTFPKGVGDTDITRSKEIVAWSKMRRYPSGFSIGGNAFFGYAINRGDIVSFSNDKTKELTRMQYGEELGYIKRVIGVASDLIQIREGFVILNGDRLKEPYTARARSTFGGTFAQDCRDVHVPEGKLFVLGDNRTGSSDSRHELGFIDINDIDHVLTFEDQKEYEKLWRDASSDDELVKQPTLDGTTYISFLNKKRREAGLRELQTKEKLVASAKKRGEVILEYNDLSFEATRSGYTMAKALADTGYSNITWGEAPSLGYYTAEELIENSIQFPDTKKFLFDKNFDDVGVSAVLGDMNGCPTQVVVQHFAGYIPPSYSRDLINNWKKALGNLREVRPSWTKLRDYPDFYKENQKEVDRMIELIDHRIRNIEEVVFAMEKNQWLTKDEQAYVNSDSILYEEQNRLAKILNSK